MATLSTLVSGSLTCTVMVTSLLIGNATLAGIGLEITGGVRSTIKLLALVAVRPWVATVIAPLVAPVGTMALIIVELLESTAAIVPLNFTVLFAGMGSKFVPVRITVDPIFPTIGSKEVIDGGRKGIAFGKTETLLLELFAVIISTLPSPSTSPIAIPFGLVPPVMLKSTFGNEPAVFLKIEIEFPVPILPFEAARSSFPSPSTSPI